MAGGKLGRIVVGDAKSLAQSAEQQRSADMLGRDREGAIFIPGLRRAPRCEQRRHCTRGHQFVCAAEPATFPV